MDYQALVGFEKAAEIFEVEKGAIRKFANAIGASDKIYFDEDIAKENGFNSLLAPISFPATFRGEASEWFLKLDRNKLLHGEQEYTYERRMVAGDSIKLIETVDEVYQKESKNAILNFIVRNRTGYDLNNNDALIFIEKSTFIMKEGKPEDD